MYSQNLTQDLIKRTRKLNTGTQEIYESTNNDIKINNQFILIQLVISKFLRITFYYVGTCCS